MDEPDAAQIVPAHATIAAEVRRIVAETLEIPVDSVRDDLELHSDLGVDSLAMIQITVELEHEFDFSAPDVDAADALATRTVGDLIAVVAAELDPQGQRSR